MSDLFLRASRMQLRFDTNNGKCTTEDLWDLPMTSKRGTSLNGLYQALSAERGAHSVASLVSVPTPETDTLDIKIEVIKTIFDIRKAENAAAKTSQANKAEAKRLRQVLAGKRNAAAENLSEEELKAKIAQLEA